ERSPRGARGPELPECQDEVSVPSGRSQRSGGGARGQEEVRGVCIYMCTVYMYICIYNACMHVYMFQVLRWISQNPSKVSQSHLAVALQRIAQLLPAPPPAVEHQDFLSLCDTIVRDCGKFDNFSLVTSLPDLSLVLALDSECVFSPRLRSLPPCLLSSLLLVRLLTSTPCFLRSESRLVPDSLSPNTMALIAKYAARHRLRETRLLDTVAEYLLKRAEQLDTKVIQRLVFPLSRMNYRPQNALELFERLEQVLEPKALSSPLATVNILMSLLQLRYCPPSLLREVFCPGFIHNSPYLGIVRRYLSLLDSAVDLEFEEYSGPRLNPAHKVLMFDHALTADEVNRKYSYKGLVAEALRQLIGEQSYKQDQILPPGYYTAGLCCRVVLSVNDKWHYCHNSQVLVGSRAMRDRHLRLLGYLLLQLPYHELEKLNGIEEVKGYLQQKLTDLPLTGPHLPL
uniref:RAP domain-containing protein n=1 Tax=Periophthalmus magnuspinnatus TaxID=409849 RepID=A0A3B3ZIV3_9GOBI